MLSDKKTKEILEKNNLLDTEQITQYQKDAEKKNKHLDEPTVSVRGKNKISWNKKAENVKFTQVKANFALNLIQDICWLLHMIGNQSPAGLCLQKRCGKNLREVF